MSLLQKFTDYASRSRSIVYTGIPPPVAPKYLLRAPPLLRTVLCLSHYFRRLEYAISPSGQLRACFKRFAFLLTVWCMVGTLATVALYTILFLAGIALAIASLVLTIAEVLLSAAVALLCAWLVLEVLCAMIRQKRTYKQTGKPRRRW